MGSYVPDYFLMSFSHHEQRLKEVTLSRISEANIHTLNFTFTGDISTMDH